MTATHANVSLIAAGSVGLALGVRLVTSPLVWVAIPERAETGAQIAVSPPLDRHPASQATVLVGRDPFRVTRRPSNVAYDPVRLAQPTTPALPKPALALVGIVWDNGRDPTALVDGFPAVDGPRPVRSGETIAGLRVKTIRPDRVVITGLDTTWTLTMREPWRDGR